MARSSDYRVESNAEARALGCHEGALVEGEDRAVGSRLGVAPPVSGVTVSSTCLAEITVVVPTYREVENLPELIERLGQVRASAGLSLRLLIVDDDSRDGTEELVLALDLEWVELLVRREDRGLSQSVIFGLEHGLSPFLVVMDADLSYPPERIPELIRPLRGDADFVIGSRFVHGGSTGSDWGTLRRLHSRGGALMARPLTRLKDPMSGFFALRRDTFLRGLTRLNPVGRKIGLELLVKCGCLHPVEVPVDFVGRRRGKGKLLPSERLGYLRHVRRLYNHRFGTWAHFAQFAVVGLSGVLVNLVLLTLLLRVGLSQKPAVGLAIALSMVWNFALNRRISFSFARHESIGRQFIGFAGACSLGATVNYFVTNLLCQWVPYVQLAAAAGVVAGTGFNFVVSRFLVFRTKDANPVVVASESRSE